MAVNKEIKPISESGISGVSTNGEKKNRVDIAFVIIIATAFYVFSLFCWLKPQNEVSEVERRKLTQRPKLETKNVMSGKYMADFEKYALDQIPFRQGFRNIKAAFSMYVLGKLDNNELYVDDGYVVKQEYPLNYESLSYAGRRFNYVYDKYLKDTSARVYLSIIPDKNHFSDGGRYLKIDYDKMVEIMCEKMAFTEYIDIFPELELEDYYRTDTHWRQERITDVAKKLAETMGTELDTEYEINKADELFYGVYFGQLALPVKGDELYYLTNNEIVNCRVYDYENDRDISMYDLSALSSKDPYEMYLYGPLSLVTITNPEADTNKELIIFRDSFGSSIAPLLATGYSKITLVDIRYITPDYLGQFIEFTDQDVLFLYNSAVLNNSETIK